MKLKSPGKQSLQTTCLLTPCKPTKVKPSMCSFCRAVLLPLLAILGVILVLGCAPATPVAPLPRPRPDNTCPVEPEKRCHRPKVVAFGADWCMWCRAGQPKLDALEKRGVDVEHINIDEHADLANQNNVTSIPVYLVIRCGHETVRTQDIVEVVRLMDEVMGR